MLVTITTQSTITGSTITGSALSRDPPSRDPDDGNGAVLELCALPECGMCTKNFAFLQSAGCWWL
jgi:hypothetical protein